MSIVPLDKFDMSSVNELQLVSDNEIEPYLVALLGWVQDLNWPVAMPICLRLSKYRKSLVEPIINVLNSNDATWKYNVITQIVNELSDPVPEEIMETLVRIMNSPNESEKLEEVDMVAKDIMVRYSNGI